MPAAGFADASHAQPQRINAAAHCRYTALIVPEGALKPVSALDAFPLTRRSVLVVAFAAAALLTLLAWAITVFYRGIPFTMLFTEGKPLAVQVAIGSVGGGALAALIAGIILRPAPSTARRAALRTFLATILRRVRPTTFDILAVSLLAGFSEEVFFRGTLQPMWGLWPAALAFALAHVGGNIFAWTKLAFAAYVFMMGALFGATCDHLGLAAAISAHAACNIVFLFMLKRSLDVNAATES